MCGNTALFAELTSLSEGVHQTNMIFELFLACKYIWFEIGIRRSAASLLQSCESLWMDVGTVDIGGTPLKPVPDVVRYLGLFR